MVFYKYDVSFPDGWMYDFGRPIFKNLTGRLWGIAGYIKPFIDEDKVLIDEIKRNFIPSPLIPSAPSKLYPNPLPICYTAFRHPYPGPHHR